jgi:hypothetical protein
MLTIHFRMVSVTTCYRIIPVILHRCETWSLTLKEEHELRCVEEQDGEEIISTYKRQSNRNLEKTAQQSPI